MMMSSTFHEAPRPAITSVMSCGTPPLMSIRLSLPSAKNPTSWLSASRTEMSHRSCPAAVGLRFNPALRHSCASPASVLATNTKWRPSGDKANDVASSVGGVCTSNRATIRSGEEMVEQAVQVATAPIVAPSTTAATHARRSRRGRAAGKVSLWWW